MKTAFVAKVDLSAAQDNALDQLRAAVYPPDVIATLPGRWVTWASPQWSLLVWDDDALVARVGVLVREINDGAAITRIGGIGGVMTHPARRGLGLASYALRAAASQLDDSLGVAYALLFCRPHLVAFYQRLQWQTFHGTIYVEQPQGKVDFSAHGAMVLDVREHAPLEGVLDLNGLPW